MIKALPLTALAAAAVLGLALPTATAQAQEKPPILSDAELRAKYSLPNSQFIEIDGQPIHYVDEGKGEAIVLVHGSFSSLRQWNDWAKNLSRDYRVIRFDRPPAGLSGPDPKGNYGMDREVELIDALTRRLGVDRFFLAVTSSGGFSGAAFAAEHPERLKGLVLNNIGIDATPPDRTHRPEAFKRAVAEDAKHGGYHVNELWRQVLLHNFTDKAKVTPALVAEWTELNNRAPRFPRSPDQGGAGYGRTVGDLARITTPTLVIWSADDVDTPLETTGRKALSLMTAASDKQFVVIPRCGHMMPIECPAEGLAVARPFFDRLSAARR